MKVFFDTSALAKRYVRESGTEQVEEVFDKSTGTLVSVICLPEIFSTLNRLKRHKQLSPALYRQLKNNILNEFKQFTVCVLSERVQVLSIQLLERFDLKAMDALHLASAQEVKADLFVSSDARQIDRKSVV